MKLYDILKNSDGEEFTVFDRDYDTEAYFYGCKDDPGSDEFDRAVIEISKLLTVDSIDENGITCNISELIESRIDCIRKHGLFYRNDINSIMEDFDNIIAGYVSTEWMKTFAKVLKGE